MFPPLNIRLGFFLAIRALRRASLWTTGLIIFVMVLAFLKLAVAAGTLLRVIHGAVDAVRVSYTGDVIVTPLNDKNYIENSANPIGLVKTLNEVDVLSARYREGGILEANYKTRKEGDKANTAAGQIVGIDPA